METVTTIVMIGKSRKEVAYTFKKEDFIRIEDDMLILESDRRRLKIPEDTIKPLILQLNGLG